MPHRLDQTSCIAGLGKLPERLPIDGAPVPSDPLVLADLGQWRQVATRDALGSGAHAHLPNDRYLEKFCWTTDTGAISPPELVIRTRPARFTKLEKSPPHPATEWSRSPGEIHQRQTPLPLARDAGLEAGGTAPGGRAPGGPRHYRTILQVRRSGQYPWRGVGNRRMRKRGARGPACPCGSRSDQAAPVVTSPRFRERLRRGYTSSCASVTPRSRTFSGRGGIPLRR